MTDFWNSYPGIREELEGVLAAVDRATRSGSPLVAEALDGLFDGDGKLLRPGMLLLAFRFGKRDPKKAVSLAAALEMLHVATLVHDDVIDDSPLRRGKPAVHIRAGRKDAVLVGDFLLSRCFLLTSEYTSPENATRLARAISVICTMEIEQDADRWRADPSVRRYLRKIMGKTALLFSLACHVGAAESKAPLRAAQSLRRIGYDIGMAFQVIDDILDYRSTAAEFGKPVGNDLRSGLATLPLLCALRSDDGALAPLVAPGSFERIDVPRVIAAVEERGGIEAARGYARRYTERALREIARLPAGEPRDLMEKLARELLIRKY
jgi:heptaprenyl diphosphate synthase